MGKIKETSTHFENKTKLTNQCDQVYAVGLISGQWILTICCYLSEGKLRFGELKKCIPNITERMLTLQLRKMEESKIVKRTVYAEVPPRVEYELTESGKRLIPIMNQLEEWGRQHKKQNLMIGKNCTN